MAGDKELRHRILFKEGSCLLQQPPPHWRAGISYLLSFFIFSFTIIFHSPQTPVCIDIGERFDKIKADFFIICGRQTVLVNPTVILLVKLNCVGRVLFLAWVFDCVIEICLSILLPLKIKNTKSKTV